VNWIAVGIGAALGAWMRWGASAWLNAVHPQMPVGTWLVNVLGGGIIGFAFAFFSHYPGLPPMWRLFVVTGFLGGLTTFSTFSLESFSLLHRGEYWWAIGHTLLHVVCSLFACVAGYIAFRLLAS
jgi:CrcB protein